MNQECTENQILPEKPKQNGSSQETTNEGRTAHMVPANLIQRTLAFALDLLVMIGVAEVLELLLPEVKNTSYRQLEFLIGFLPQFFYSGYFYSVRGATPGKLAFNMMVVNDSGSKLGFTQAGLRDTLGRTFSIIICGFGFLVAFLRKDRKALHDRIFHTNVINCNK